MRGSRQDLWRAPHPLGNGMVKFRQKEKLKSKN
jgi:hypothetical protein